MGQKVSITIRVLSHNKSHTEVEVCMNGQTMRCIVCHFMSDNKYVVLAPDRGPSIRVKRKELPKKWPRLPGTIKCHHHPVKLKKQPVQLVRA